MKSKLFLQSFLAVIFSLGLANFSFAQTADSTPPSDLENPPRVVQVGNGEVTLEWDVATDNVGVTAYKVYYGKTSLTNQNGNGKAEYEGSTKFGNINKATVTGLTNDINYYFAITAVDAADNESEYYSPEAQGMPKMSGDINSNLNAGSQNSNINSVAMNTNQNVGTSMSEVSNFQSKIEGPAILLSWSMASNPNLADQMLFVSKDNGTTYDTGVHLGKSSSYIFTSLEGNTTYTFKIVSIDSSNLKSEGVTTNITTGSLESGSLPNAKDVSNLVSKFRRVTSMYSVMLSWTLPKDVQDIVSQIVYQSKDGNIFTQIANLTPDISTYEVENLSGGKYFFKITTKDKAGQESKGVIKMVELPTTGPALVGVIGISLLGGMIMKKRKK